MNTKLLNVVSLDGGVIIKKGASGGGGGNTPGGGGDTPTPDMPVIGDGKTYLYIKIAAKGRMDVPLYFSQTVANGVTIDWGDGSAPQTLSGTGNKNTTHTYADIGEYTISLNPADGCTLGLGNYITWNSYYSVMGNIRDDNTVYRNMLKTVEIGNNVALIDEYAFSKCYSLSSVVISDSVTKINDNAFDYCYNLSHLKIGNSVEKIGSYAFNSCYCLSNIDIPNSVKSIGNNAFYGCTMLSSIAISEGVTSIGESAFNRCSSLTSIVIPDSVNSLGQRAFEYCDSLKSVVIGDGVTSLQFYTFNSCNTLSDVKIGNSVTSLYKAFYGCVSLEKIIIPNGVTSLNGAFNSCYSLSTIKIPDSVKSLGMDEFQYCYGMTLYDFSQCTSVPTLGGSSYAFEGIKSDCKIVVPDALYDEWIAATNWSSFKYYIVKASEFNG